MKFPTSKSVDVMIVSEGTYPFVRGGVSSWVHQLITGLPDFKFGILFMGSNRDDYGDILYELPQNLVHLEAHYLFENKAHLPKKRKGDSKAFAVLKEFYNHISKDEPMLPDSMKKISFFTKEITLKDFLYSKGSWEFMRSIYEKNCPDIPFIDFFWTLRNIHTPIWKIASIVENMPEVGVIHSQSTGYAGFLSFLASNNMKIPFILTEHGIYTRERKIDVLSAKWISYVEPSLLEGSLQELNYVKQMWVRFFEKIALLSYNSADKIISLYRGAKKIQVGYGADEEKCLTIPNGVDIKHLGKIVKKRAFPPPKVVTLIGRVVSIKDIKTFIRAISIAREHIPYIEGWIVGSMDEERRYADECIEMVNSYDLKHNVHFLGFQKIDDVLSKSAILTLTSISEGMPLVVLEGFASGLPCITTDVGSCKELIYGAIDEDDVKIGEAGAVTPIADAKSLAKEYVRFLSDDKLWKKAQESALKRVSRYYQEDTFLKRYKELYEEFL